MYSNNFCYDDNSQLSQYYSPIFIWMCYGWCNKFSRVKSPKSETRCTLLWIPCLSWQHWIPLSAMVLLLLFKFKLKSRFGLRLHECQFLAKVAPVTDFLFMLFRFYWAEIWCQTWSTSKLTVNHLQIALEVFWWVVWLKQQRDVIFIVWKKNYVTFIIFMPGHNFCVWKRKIQTDFTQTDQTSAVLEFLWYSTTWKK